MCRHLSSLSVCRRTNVGLWIRARLQASSAHLDSVNWHGNSSRRDRHFTWSYEPGEGLALCRIGIKCQEKAINKTLQDNKGTLRTKDRTKWTKALLTYLIPLNLRLRSNGRKLWRDTSYTRNLSKFSLFLQRNLKGLGSKFSYDKVCMNETSDLARRGHLCVRNEGLAFCHACGHFCASAFHSTDSEKRETARSLTSDQRAMNAFWRGEFLKSTYLVIQGRHFVHLRMYFMIEIVPN